MRERSTFDSFQSRGDINVSNVSNHVTVTVNRENIVTYDHHKSVTLKKKKLRPAITGETISSEFMVAKVKI